MMPADLDALFPDRHARAEELDLHPSLRTYFVPLEEGERLTEKQRAAIFAHLHTEAEALPNAS